MRRGDLKPLLELSADAYDIELADLLGPSRRRRIVHARVLVVWALRSFGPPWSFGEIAHVIGRVDGATARHLNGNAEWLLQRCPHFQAAAEKLRARFERKIAP